MLSNLIAFVLCMLLVVLIFQTKLFKESAVGIWLKWKVLNPMAQIFVIIIFGYMIVFAAVKPPATPAVPPLGLEYTPKIVFVEKSGSAATDSKTSKDYPSMLAGNGYKRLAETGESFISKVVTNTALPWLNFPSNAIVYSGWTNYGVTEDTFWVSKTNPAASWDFIYGDKVVDGAHVSSSGTISFGVPKGSPTPHEMPDGTGINFLAPFHSSLSVIPPNGRFWHHATDSNSVRFTWQNFLVGRDTNNAISFQAELFINGDYTYRYAFPPHFLSFTNDFVIGAQFGGVGETFAMNNYSNLADGLDIIWDLPDSQLDTDGDGTYDIVEIYYGFDPNAYTPEDWDNDGLSNNFEYYYTNSVSTNGIERLNARLFDSDGDKLPDLFEVMYTNFNPLIAHSTIDESLTGDPDNDGLNNYREMVYGTNPKLSDTDGDGDNDYYEVYISETDPLDSSNEYSEAVVNCTMELSAVDDNEYMLLVMGSSTNILLTSSCYYPISESMKICSTNQQLDVKLSRSLEVDSNESPILSDVSARVYSMDPWVITCYGDDYPGYRPPSPYRLNNTITRNSGSGGEGGGGVTFHIPKMTVDIISSYSSSYYYYILMCGCNNLADELGVTAKISIKSMAELYDTPCIFNPKPITCTATGGGDSVFQESSDVDTIYFGSTIIGFDGSLSRRVNFSLAMGVDSPENFYDTGDYQYDITVEATEAKMGTCSNDVGISVDVDYSHGSWSITSTMNPSNVINILNSTDAYVGIDFNHSECADYFLNGMLCVIPDGNMDVFTLEYVEQYVSIEGSGSAGEGFSVLGCSDDLGDMIVDLEFYGGEYHSASYSLTSYAFIASNRNSTAEMYTGRGDADNDGTNNANDLDNAGPFMELLIKTHPTATSAHFRLDYDESKIKIWTEDSSAMITRTNSYIPQGNLIQTYHNYSYNDLFEEGAERILYVQGLAPGEHDIDVVYVLDGVDLWTEDLSVSFVGLRIKCNGEFLENVTVNVGEKISLEAVLEPYVPSLLSYSWTIPDHGESNPSVIENYITTQSQGYINYLIEDELNEDNVELYWIRPQENVTVSCSLLFDEFNLQKDIVFSINEPIVSLESQITTNIPAINIMYIDNYLELVYGTPNSPAITWTGSLISNNSTTGQLAFVQLWQADSKIVTENSDVIVQVPVNQNVLDRNIYSNDILYDNSMSFPSSTNSFSTSDMPGMQLNIVDDQVNYYFGSHISTITRNDRFSLYLMFKSSKDTSIWIPLRRLDWWWSAQVVSTSGTNTWSIQSHSYQDINLPISQEDHSPPEWSYQAPLGWQKQ